MPLYISVFSCEMIKLLFDGLTVNNAKTQLFHAPHIIFYRTTKYGICRPVKAALLMQKLSPSEVNVPNFTDKYEC